MPVTAVAVAEAGNEIYSGGIDNDIRVWDFRKKGVAYSLLGHADTITSLEVSPDSQFLLSNSHDSTVRTWDIRPFAPSDRSVKTYDGAPTGIEKNLLRASWDVDGKRIAAGSGDRTAVVWDTASGKLLQKLPGHKGAVNDVRFSPTGEPIRKSFPLPSPLLLLVWIFSSTLDGESQSLICLLCYSSLGQLRQDHHARRARKVSLG